MFELYDEEEEKANMGAIYHLCAYDYSVRVLGVGIGMINSSRFVSWKNLYKMKTIITVRKILIYIRFLLVLFSLFFFFLSLLRSFFLFN